MPWSQGETTARPKLGSKQAGHTVHGLLDLGKNRRIFILHAQVRSVYIYIHQATFYCTHLVVMLGSFSFLLRAICK